MPRIWNFFCEMSYLWNVLSIKSLWNDFLWNVPTPGVGILSKLSWCLREGLGKIGRVGLVIWEASIGEIIEELGLINKRI